MLAKRVSKPRRLVKRIAVAFGVAVMLSGGVYLVWFSPYFKLTAINVEGANLVDADIIAGPVGGNILFWKPPIANNEIPQLASLAFEKDFINHEVKITVKEREKVLIWCLESSEECYWADEDGFIFTQAPNPEGTFLISVVRDYTHRRLKVGDTVLPKDLFLHLGSILSLLKDVDVPVDVLRIDDLKFKEATAVTSNGPEIYFSLTFDPRFGEGVIDSLRSSPEWSAIRYIDLRVENRAYYSL